MVPQVGGDGAVDRIELVPDIATLPVFVRAGTILAKQPLVQSLSERPKGMLELHVYPGQGCAGEIYDDDGHSLGFARGEYLRQEIRCLGDGESLTGLEFAARQGRFQPWWDGIRIVIHGPGSYSAMSGGRELPVSRDSDAIAFAVPDLPQGGRIRLAREN